MGVPGRRPKPAGERRNRHALTHDWIEVEDKPYDGPRPDLPQLWVTDDDGARVRKSWPAATRQWWEVISRMPHCVLWTPAEWQQALDAAVLHARWILGGKHATEIRIRERQLGVSMDARRALRILYVPPKDSRAGAGDQEPAGVVNLADYRDLYG